MSRTETSVNPSKSQVAFAVQRQIRDGRVGLVGAYFNASQSSLQCLCGKLAVLTRYLKSRGLLSGSGTEKSLHTSRSQS